MRVLPVGMKEHLLSGATTLCWCWKLTRTDGRIMGFTDHDLALSFGGVSYLPDTGMTASEIHEAAGLSIDNADISGILQSDVITEQDIELGYYDDCLVEVFRVNWTDTSQALLYKVGTIGELTRTRDHFVAEFRGMPYKAQVPQGRVYQYQCDAVLGDARCGASVSGRAFSATVTQVLSAAAFQMQFIAVPSDAMALLDDYFARGRIVWTTGASSSKVWEIQKHKLVGTGGMNFSIGLWEPGYYTPVVGDVGTLHIGCNKSFKTCREKFSNGLNYRGYPSIPGTDLMMKYATKQTNNTGESIVPVFE